MLRGNLAPDGAVIKPAAAEERLHRHTGPAVVFENYDDMAARIDDPDLDIDENSVIVLRSAGPQGAPGMPEWGQLPIPKKILEKGIRDMVRISDARMSGTSYGACVLHVAPESHVGGPLALVRTGDLIELDVPGRRLELKVTDEELEKRRADWQQPPAKYARGYGALYLQHITQANEGCDFDFLEAGRADPGAGDPLMLPGCRKATFMQRRFRKVAFLHRGARPDERDDDHRRASGAPRCPAPSTRSPRRGTAASSAPCPRAGPADCRGRGRGRRRGRGACGGARPPTSGCASCCARPTSPTSARRRSPTLISAENGKSIREATVEASRCGDVIRTSAFEGAHLYGESLPLDAAPGTGFDKIGFTVRQPCGVVLAITPFNYPGLLAIHKIAPALAAGNAVVLKPAELTPLTALALADCFLEAGPAGPRALGGHRARQRDRRRAGGRPARPEGVVHRVDGGGGADLPHRRGEEAVAGAGLVVAGGDPAGRGPGGGRDGRRRRRLRQRGPGLHLGPARDHPPGGDRRLPRRPRPAGRRPSAPATRRRRTRRWAP